MKINFLFYQMFVAAAAFGAHSAFSQTTSFTYQGQLQANGAPANGNYDFIFELVSTNNGFNQQVGSAMTNLNVGVTNGIFTTVLANIPSTNFNVPNLLLDMAVRSSGSTGGYSGLNPFQPLTSVPYATVAQNFSGTVTASQVTGAISPAQLPTNLVTNNAKNIVLSGTFSGDGSGLTNLMQTNSTTTTTTPISTPILNMIWINAGTFVMGSPTTENGRGADEVQTLITFTNGFWMAHHSVTQGEYVSVMTNNPSSFGGNLNLPVQTVTWTNAINFCAYLTLREQAAGRLPSGWTYRLPTEAEWEYSCRALTTTQFYWGSDFSATNIVNYAWYSGDISSPQPVGQKLPNAWGLVDMSGNVAEWCGDWYATLPGGSLTNYTGATNGTLRVYRGGGYDFSSSNLRSAKRFSTPPTSVFSDLGFRVVLAPN